MVFDPTTFGTDLGLWLAADEFVGAFNGVTMTSWPDGSTHGNNGTSTTSPAWYSENFSQFYNTPVHGAAVAFTGTSHFTFGDIMTSATSGEIFMVFRQENNSVSQGLYSFGAKTGASDAQSVQATGFGTAAVLENFGRATGERLSFSVPHLAGSGFVPESWHIWNVATSATSHDVWVDRTNVYTNSSAHTVFWNTAPIIGRSLSNTTTLSSGFDGFIAEILVFKRKLTTGERLDVNNYLARHFIPITAHAGTSRLIVELGDVSNFVGGLSTGATSYSWDFDDTTTGTGNEIAHTFTSLGTYDVVLTASGPSGTDTDTVTVQVVSSISPPANDAFASRVVVSGYSGASAWIDLTGCGIEAGEPQPYDNLGPFVDIDPSVWYEWTCPTPAPEVIEFRAHSRPYQWYIYNEISPYAGGPTLGALTHVPPLTFNNNQVAERQYDAVDYAAFVFTPTAGVKYYLQLGTYPGSTADSIGDIRLSWGPPGELDGGTNVGNDDLADRDTTTVTGNGSVSIDLTGNTIQEFSYYENEFNIGIGGDDGYYNSEWYEWTCPATGFADPASFTLTISGQSTNNGAALNVFRGAPSWQTMSSINNDGFFDFPIELDDGFETWTATFTPIPGETYYITVGCYDPDDFPPTITMSWELEGVDETDPDIIETGVWTDIEDGTDVPPDTVVTPDLTGIGVLRRVSETYGTPTVTNGRPDGWSPSSTTDVEWGTIGIAIDGVDVTKIRGVKTQLEQLMLQEPFGEGPAQLTIGGATEFDYGQAGFEWLEVETNVDISHFNPAGAYVKTLWSGIVTSMEYTSDGWSLDLDGAFAGVLGMLAHRPKLTEQERDIGLAMIYSIRRAGRGASRRKTITEVEVGITTRDRGQRGETELEYVTRLLNMCQEHDGDHWTFGRVAGVRRKYELRLKDRTTIDVTVHARARGVTHQLRRDFSQVVREIFGEGVNENGGRWRGTKLPNVGKETVPPYPGTPLDVGSTGDSVFVWQAEALSDGHLTGDLEALIGGEFTETDADAAREIQDEAGLPITGVVNEATWDATWSNGNTDLNLGGARFDPIAYDTRVIPFTYSSNGSVMDVNPAWDRTLIPIGRFTSYGQNVSKKFAKKSAKAELAKVKNASWSGTITIDDVDPVEMSRLEIREGMNIRLKWFGGVSTGIVLHIAGVHWSRSGPSYSVTLDVDEKARDLLTLAEMRERNRAAKNDPAKLAMAQLRKSAQVRDTPGAWDTEGGYGTLPLRDCVGGEWNVFVIAGGQYGTLSRVILNTQPDTRFCVALFGAQPTKTWLQSNASNPLSDPGDDTYLFWDKPALQDGLQERLFIEAWGGFKQRAGYSPGYETHPTTGKDTAHPVTGKLDVLSGTEYALDEEPKLFVAVWPEVDTSIHGQIRLLPNE